MKSLPTLDPGSHATNLTSTLAKGLKHCKFYSKEHRHSEAAAIVKTGFLKAESSNRAALGYVKVTPALQGDGKSGTSPHITEPVAPKPGVEGRTQISCRGQSQGTEARGGEGGLLQVLIPVLALLRVAGQDTFVPTCLLPEVQPQRCLPRCSAAPPEELAACPTSACT